MPTLAKILAFASIACCVSPCRGAVDPVHARHGMVVSSQVLASQAGVDIMRAGGNAVDAAVAVGFALAVVHPGAGNLGGGGFMLIRMADGSAHFIDYREKAPLAARQNMFQDSHGELTPGASVYGPTSIGVPGSVAGLALAQKKYGKLSLKQTMAPAIRLARDGYALSYGEAHELRDEHLSQHRDSRRIFQRDGKYYEQGEVFRQPELATTLERIASDPQDFYRGAMARELAAAIQKEGGIITPEDLAAYEAKERGPLRGSYRGYEVMSAPPPSSGGTVLIETLNILEGFQLAPLGPESSASIHLIAEAFRRAFFDRAEFMGDPDFASVPVAPLIDKAYAAAWRESIDPTRASSSSTLKRPENFVHLDQEAATAPPDGPHTTHYSVVDNAGNAVATTTTLNDWFGSRITAGSLGFLLNDEMDDFTSKVGAPNSDGLIQGAINAIAPGKRPLSSMTPTIVSKNGRPFLVLGSPGSSKIISTVANVLLNVVDYGMNLQEAVDAPRFHHQWMPDALMLEQWFSPDTVESLKRVGYTVQLGLHEDGAVLPYWSEAECIEIDPLSQERLGSADRRSDGKAVGY